MSTTAPIPELRTEQTPPLYRDVRVLRWVGQLVVVGLVIAFAWYLMRNVRTNLESTGLPTGFAFLDGRFGSQIPGLADAADFDVQQAFYAGFMNTVRVILFGIPGCTIIGVLIGIARLSDNLAARTFGTVYVEAFRNVPALVWIYLTHFAIALSELPRIEDAPAGFGLVLSNKGIGIPWFNPEAKLPVFLAALAVGMLLVYATLVWRRTVNERTGAPARGLLYGTLAFIIVAVIANFAAGNALALDGSSVADGGRQLTGGMTIQVPYFSITVALTLYTASHVAEVVRGAILAIHKGQAEAANAIALTTFQRYRFVILPQAFRIMIPPLANQYLNITKNSSLAVAVGYVEIAAIFNRIVNNAAPAVQGIVILMVLYLVFSLSISLVANYFNRRLSLESR